GENNPLPMDRRRTEITRRRRRGGGKQQEKRQPEQSHAMVMAGGKRGRKPEVGAWNFTQTPRPPAASRWWRRRRQGGRSVRSPCVRRGRAATSRKSCGPSPLPRGGARGPCSSPGRSP